MNSRIHILVLATLLVAGSACSRSTGVAGGRAGYRQPGHPPGHQDEVTEISGQLIEARCYFNTGAIGGDHTHCAFLSAKGNLPLGVLTAGGELIFVTAAPSTLAAYVTRAVRMRGHFARDRRILKPVSMRVQKGRSWTRPILLPQEQPRP